MRQIEPAATRFFINARQPAQSEPSLMLPDAAAGCTMPSAETAPRAREHNRPPSPPAAPPGRLPFRTSVPHCGRWRLRGTERGVSLPTTPYQNAARMLRGARRRGHRSAPAP